MSVLATCPDDLVRRRGDSKGDAVRIEHLTRWLNVRGLRVTWWDLHLEAVSRGFETPYRPEETFHKTRNLSKRHRGLSKAA